MTQPFDRNHKIDALGPLDAEAGEFWVDNPFRMVREGYNLSAYERNKFFLNADGKQFLDASFASAADLESDSRSVVVADFDADHAPDLLVSNVGGVPLRMFKNQFPKDTHRVQVRLVGRESNRFGIGARVTALCGERTVVRDAFPANGLMGQSPIDLLIGTNDAVVLTTLTVRWPTGKTQSWTDVKSDCLVTIHEGQAELEIEPFATQVQ